MMRRMIGLTFLLAACSSNPQPAAAPTPMPAPPPAPAPAPAPAASSTRDILGTWDFSVDAGGQVVPGEITINRAGNTYGGTISPQGMEQASIRTLTLNADRIIIVADTPSGEATFNGQFSSDSRTVTGTVSFQGQALPFNMRKR